MSLKDKLKIKIEMIEAGIVPALSPSEFDSMFKTMSENDKRVAKRKFRKVWKKALKDNPDYSDLLTNGKGETPTKVQMLNRPNIVIREIKKKLDSD